MATPDRETLRTRASLIDKLADLSNQAGWREFFDTYWGLIYGVARKAGLSDADAQDVVQDTMSSVARQMPTFRYDPARGSFKGWLLTLTRWRIVDRLRKKRVDYKEPPPESPTGTDVIAQIPDPASLLPDAVWEKEWEANLVQAAKANLRRKVDPQKLQIFDFYVTKEWPAEKVAEKFQVAIEQVYLAKHRITEMLKAEVQRLERESF